ncbi:hypothetical protein LEP1GSC043_4374 [Leptospira weilii str. Ecochallenge]|uniref:Uncharacterized protein n=1 Tax=Leptospira weilii str. Ecochallenge TaxID=1049986 RepID=N1U6B4_9LEPT|nr:hypothetical protein LEP1GSC043_4374 [Leptospira weilii str. Ecochallenge]
MKQPSRNFKSKVIDTAYQRKTDLRILNGLWKKKRQLREIKSLEKSDRPKPSPFGSLIIKG